MTYQEQSEFGRLKRADVAQGQRVADLTAEVKRLQEDLTQARLDLIQADALRTGYLQGAMDHAQVMQQAMARIEQMEPVVEAARQWWLSRKLSQTGDQALANNRKLDQAVEAYEKIIRSRS